MTSPTRQTVLSTECVNDWHDECQIRACMCDCHLASVPARHTPNPRPKISASRERVYAALVAYHRAYGHAPSTRELAAHLNLGVGTINYHIHRLDAEGRVRLAKGLARTVTPVGVIR